MQTQISAGSLRQGGFRALFLARLLGAFNDNVFKILVSPLAIEAAAIGHVGGYLSLAARYAACVWPRQRTAETLPAGFAQTPSTWRSWRSPIGIGAPDLNAVQSHCCWVPGERSSPVVEPGAAPSTARHSPQG
jgi:hypothetical protein